MTAQVNGMLGRANLTEVTKTSARAPVRPGVLRDPLSTRALADPLQRHALPGRAAAADGAPSEDLSAKNPLLPAQFLVSAKLASPSGAAERDASQAATRALSVQSPPQTAGRADPGQSSRPPAAVAPAIRAGAPLDSSTRAFFESRFNESFDHVRVHTGPETSRSARLLGARAFTYGSDICFGANAYAPGTESGRRLLGHELAHVSQQSGGGGGLTQVVTGVQLARSLDDWLQGSPDISQMEYTDLLADIDEIRQYLQRQTTSSEESVQLESALAQLQREVARRDAAAGRSSRPRRGARRRGGGASPSNASAAADIASQERSPHVLTEQSSVQYDSPAEMRDEYNLIMRWLERSDLTPSQRSLLLAERSNLAPQLNLDRAHVVAERHASRVQAALTPEDDDENGLRTQARTIQGIVPDPAQPGTCYIYQGDERIAISVEQAENLRFTIRRELGRAASGMELRAGYYWDRYHAQVALNRDSPITSSISGWLADVHDPGAELSARHHALQQQLSRIRDHIGAGRMEEAAALLPAAERTGQQIRALARAFYEGYIEGAEIAQHRLEFTRDAAFAVAGAIGAVVAAPLVAGAVGAGGLGLTGTLAAVTTTTGTGLVVGTGMAVARGGSAATGTALAGGSWGEVSQAFTAEGVRGFREGFISGAGAGAARVLGPMLGVGSNLGYQALRRIAAEALINATTTMADVLASGGSLSDAVAAGVRSAALSVPGALVGGSESPIARYLVAPLTAGGTSYLGAVASGQSPDQALAQAGVAIASNIAISQAQHGSEADQALVARGRSMGASARGVVSSARRQISSATAAVTIGTADALPTLGTGEGGAATLLEEVSPSHVTGSGAQASAGHRTVEAGGPAAVHTDDVANPASVALQGEASQGEGTQPSFTTTPNTGPVATQNARPSPAAELQNRYGGRIRSTGGALEELFRRAGNADVPVQRRGATPELRAALRYLDEGGPGGRAVQVLEFVPSRSGARTPDMVVHYQDGGVERVEVTTVTSAPRGRLDTGPTAGPGAREQLASATRSREPATQDLVAALVRKGAANGQLAVPMSGVPVGGAIVLEVSRGTGITAMADAAVSQAGPRLDPAVRRIEVIGMERASPSAPLQRVVRTYVRSGPSSFTLVL